MPDDPRFEIQQGEIKEVLAQMGGLLGRVLPADWHFALFLVPETGENLYVSDLDRAQFVNELRAFLDEYDKTSAGQTNGSVSK